MPGRAAFNVVVPIRARAVVTLTVQKSPTIFERLQIHESWDDGP